MSAVVAILTLLAYACPFVNPVQFSWLAFFGTAFPWILLANVVLIIVWTCRLNRFALYHLLMVALGWQYITGFIGFNFGKAAIPETAIRVATHNLGGLWVGQRKLTDGVYEKMAADYARFLQENGFPDILCTQETSGKFYRILAEKMGYAHTFNLKKGTVILSRFPMEGGGEIPFGKTANSTLWVDLRIGKNLLRVYNVHLQSNKVTSDTEKVIEEAELNEGETWHDIGNVLNKVGDATEIRAEQAQLLCDHIAACPNPVIVCGDFNDTPNSYVYNLLATGLSDTFREKGAGFGTTFGGALPLLRIDYVLTEPRFIPYSCETVHGRFSDHYPVFVSLGIR